MSDDFENDLSIDKKASRAFKTIAEVSEDLKVPPYVLRFWEKKFSQVSPVQRAGGRRYYRPEDVLLLKKIEHFLYKEGYTIKGVQKLLKEGALNLLADRPQTQKEGTDLTCDLQKNINQVAFDAVISELEEITDLLKKAV